MRSPQCTHPGTPPRPPQVNIPPIINNNTPLSSFCALVRQSASHKINKLGQESNPQPLDGEISESHSKTKKVIIALSPLFSPTSKIVKKIISTSKPNSVTL